MRRKKIFIEKVNPKYHVEVKEDLLMENKDDVVGQIITFLNYSHNTILITKMGQIKITPLSGSYRKMRIVRKRR